MESLKIERSISKKVKYTAFIAGGYLLALSLALGIHQAINDKFQLIFYIGVAGAIIAILLIMMVTVWQSILTVEIDNEQIKINLPGQHIDGTVKWESVSQIGVGLSFITLSTEMQNYKIDFGNLKYNEIKEIKSKLIEVCETRNIPFGNI